MKSLIVVAGYGIKNHNKRIEVDLLSKLQSIRDKYDILYISHTPSNELIHDLIDYSIYDSKNSLIYDFKYKPSVWWGNDVFWVETTEKYRFCTHVSIFRMMSMASNFAKFMSYDKLHYLEYDLLLKNNSIIDTVDDYLTKHDCVTFRRNNGWLFGCYFAFKPNKYTFLDEFSEDKFISYLKLTDNNFTERCIRKLLVKGYDSKVLSCEENFGEKGQLVSSLVKQDTLAWTIPVYNEKTDMFDFFILMDKKINTELKVIINDNVIHSFNMSEKDLNRWIVKPLMMSDKVEKIEVYQNQKIDYTIDFNKIEKSKFIIKNKIVKHK